MTEVIEPITLLLVDDEPRNLDALAALLEQPSYILLRAEAADVALKLLLQHDVAAIVLHIKMPGTSGFELAQLIKGTKRFRQVPILFVTAFLMDEQDMVAGYDAGAVDYLTKPINPVVLKHKVAVFAELFRKTRALAELSQTLEERVAHRTAELERSEAALRVADKQKDQFLAVLAHELRNPLAPLSMGVDILLKQPFATEEGAAAETLPRMKRQIDHMVHLIDDLLDIARVTGGAMDLRRTHVNLRDIVATALERVQPVFALHGHVIAVDDGLPVFVMVDAPRVAQILGNLLHNAAKFTPDGGTVRISVGAEAGEAVLRVIDQGIGVEANELERVFDLFVRLNGTSGKAERGLGIGLALARRLARMHGGSLSAASEGAGRGATFTLRLPLEVAVVGVATPAAATELSRPEPHQLTIVVVEDNPDVAEMLSLWLEGQGHRVTVASSGEEALEVVPQVRPDVVFCDLGLPTMDGLEVARRVRRSDLSAQPRLIALSGWGREEDRKRSREAGFDDHLVKPVGVEQLLGVLRSVSEGK